MKIKSMMVLAAFAIVVAAAPHPASAQAIAYAVPGTTNLRAGPGTQYPIIGKVRGGTEVYVYGCLANRSWCDILVGGIRGWIYSRRLEFVYAGRRVLVPRYYAYFGAPIIRFDFSYWDRYYWDRPWYRDWRPRWRIRPPDTPPGYNDDGFTNWPGVEHPGQGGRLWRPRGGGPGGVETPPGAPGDFVGSPGVGGGGVTGGGGFTGGGTGYCPPLDPNC